MHACNHNLWSRQTLASFLHLQHILPRTNFQSTPILNPSTLADTVTMKWANRFQSRMATSNYRRRSFFAIKIFQLLSSLVDFAIMVYFVTKLRGSHMSIPWTFIVVSSNNPSPTEFYLPSPLNGIIIPIASYCLYHLDNLLSRCNQYLCSSNSTSEYIHHLQRGLPRSLGTFVRASHTLPEIYDHLNL